MGDYSNVVATLLSVEPGDGIANGARVCDVSAYMLITIEDPGMSDSVDPTAECYYRFASDLARK